MYLELVKVTQFPVLLRWLLRGFRSGTHLMHRIFRLLLLRQNLLNSKKKHHIRQATNRRSSQSSHKTIPKRLFANQKETSWEKFSSSPKNTELFRKASHYFAHPKENLEKSYPRRRRRFSVLCREHRPSEPSCDALGSFHFQRRLRWLHVVHFSNRFRRHSRRLLILQRLRKVPISSRQPSRSLMNSICCTISQQSMNTANHLRLQERGFGNERWSYFRDARRRSQRGFLEWKCQRPRRLRLWGRS